MKSNLFALAATIILLELEQLSALPGAELEVEDEVSETTRVEYCTFSSGFD